MSSGTSLVCSSCDTPLRVGATVCPNCGAPVTSAGGAQDASNRTPVSQPGGSSAFAWDALTQRLRELTVDEYEILAELGRGGMAAVYLAYHFGLQKNVALKVMSPAIMLTEGMVERFRSEAVTQANLEHANVAAVHAVRQDAELHYIVMQYVPGRSLSEVLGAEVTAGRTLSLSVIRSLLYQVGSALSYAHRKGVIHRDIKPANVLMNADGDAVVTDFGIAKVVASPVKTMTGMVVGTAPYMSPEQCYAAELTAASDQYSLGILAYELLTGKPPFVGNSFAVMQAHVTEPPPRIIPRRPDCPADVEAGVLRMLAKRREERFADISAALAAIGAHSALPNQDDPVRSDLIRLADVAGVQARLGDLLRVPLSPIPGSGGPARARNATPPASVAVPSRPAAPVSIAAVRISAPRSEMQEGETTLLTAEILDRNGNVVTDRPVSWRSSHPEIASVSLDGSITARAAGRAVVTAVCDLKSGTLAVVVAPPPVASLQITVPKEKLRRRERVQLTAVARSALDIALSDRIVRWETSNPAIARVTRHGLIRAGAPGIATITATSEGQRAYVAIEVLPTPAKNVSWVKRAAVVVGALSAIGVVTFLLLPVNAPPVKPLVVPSPRVSRIDFSPDVRTVRVGTRLPLKAVARDSVGQTVAVPIRWTVSNNDVAALEADGSVVFRTTGNVTITAIGAEKSASAEIMVLDSASLAPGIRRVVLRTSMSSPFVGDTFDAVTRVTDAKDVVRTDKPVTLTSSNPSVVSVLEAGRLLARVAGSATVRASVEGVSDERKLVVSAAPLATLRLSPASATLMVGEAVQLSLEAVDTRNRAMSTPRVEWRIVPEGGATVSSDGRVTGKTAGSVRVMASAEGKTAVAELTIRPLLVISDPPPPPPDSPGIKTDPVSPFLVVSAIYAGGTLSCARLADADDAMCWGRGQAKRTPLGINLSTLAIGNAHACGLTRDGTAFCWGANDDGQLGASRPSGARPAPVEGELRFTSISTGRNHTCAIATGGAAYCWGSNNFGQLGDGSRAKRGVPTPVKGNRVFRMIATGATHTCGVAADGATYCWGDDLSGAVGGGRNEPELEPVNVDRGRFAFQRVYTGGQFSCGLTQGGTAYCWGENGKGQVGVGNRDERIRLNRKVQREVSFTQLTLGERHVCGLTANGEVYCWGDNALGQLGNGSEGDRGGRTAPTEVASEARFDEVQAGAGHSCAVSRVDREVYCWGDNSRAQLGSSGEARVLVPTRLRGGG